MQTTGTTLLNLRRRRCNNNYTVSFDVIDLKMVILHQPKRR